jgi:hypothetical protein
MQNSSHARRAAIETRLAAALPMSPWLTGILLASALTVIGLGLHSLDGVNLIVSAGYANPHMAPQTHVTILCSTLLAYGLIAARWISERDQSRSSLTRADWVRSRVAGAAGVFVGLVVIFVTTRQIGIQEPDRNPWNLGEIYVDLLSLLLLWGIGRAVFFTVRGIGVADHGNPVVDLWDITPLYRYGRQGLRRALAWSIGISLVVRTLERNRIVIYPNICGVLVVRSRGVALGPAAFDGCKLRGS